MTRNLGGQGSPSPAPHCIFPPTHTHKWIHLLDFLPFFLSFFFTSAGQDIDPWLFLLHFSASPSNRLGLKHVWECSKACYLKSANSEWQGSASQLISQEAASRVISVWRCHCLQICQHPPPTLRPPPSPPKKKKKKKLVAQWYLHGACM